MARPISNQAILAAAAVVGFRFGGTATAALVRAVPGLGGLGLPPEVGNALGAIAAFMIVKRFV